ncbi:MAG: radical SAM protein [Candidatus Omnitrophota bacterium]|jgi:putative pyruvate formate lyase activating enzyme
MPDYPSYLKAFQNNQLQKTAEDLQNSLACCCICPRKCKVNRLKGETGFCKTALLPKVYSFMAHFGEEPPISGTKGSGTIFFANCNMSCVYCQNYEFSQLGQGKEYDSQELSEIMLKLQGMGCHNINLVTPTHVLPQILKALELAVQKGLYIPLVYNTSGYESPAVIKMLDGIVDIYLPDMRYADASVALRLSASPDYPQNNRLSVKEMHRQVGVAQIDDAGLIKRGLIIRHLVLPNALSGTEETMKFISAEISEDTYISLMSQYLPYHNGREHKEISRRLKKEEYKQAEQIMQRYNLHNGWIQESFGLERFAGVNIKPA